MTGYVGVRPINWLVMMMASSVAVGTVPVSQFDASLHSAPDGGAGVVSIQTTAAAAVPAIVTVTF